MSKWHQNEHGQSYYLPTSVSDDIKRRYGTGWATKLSDWVRKRGELGDPLPPDFEIGWELLDKICGPIVFKHRSAGMSAAVLDARDTPVEAEDLTDDEWLERLKRRWKVLASFSDVRFGGEE